MSLLCCTIPSEKDTAFNFWSFCPKHKGCLKNWFFTNMSIWKSYCKLERNIANLNSVKLIFWDILCIISEKVISIYESQSKHLKGQLDPPVRDVTLFNQGGPPSAKRDAQNTPKLFSGQSNPVSALPAVGQLWLSNTISCNIAIYFAQFLWIKKMELTILVKTRMPQRIRSATGKELANT